MPGYVPGFGMWIFGGAEHYAAGMSRRAAPTRERFPVPIRPNRPAKPWARVCLVTAMAAVAFACAYPRRTTHIVPLPPGAVALSDRPAGMWQLELIGAELPVRKRTGLPWDDDNSPPDPFVRLFVGGRMIWESEVLEDTSRPEWNVTLPRNVLLARGGRFHVEVWDHDSAVSADPIGTHSSNGRPSALLPNTSSRLLLGTTGAVVMRITPPVPHSGVGLEVEVRSDALVVLQVMPHSPASRSGIQVGDRIVGFGPERVANLGDDEAFGRLALAVDRGTQIQVRSKGQHEERSITFDKAPLWLAF